MGEILRARADQRAINITLNSFGTPLNEPAMRATDRKRLYPSIGFLYPAGTAKLAEAADEGALGAAISAFPVYREIWAVHQNESVEDRSIDDAFYEREVQMLELAFEGQMHFGIYYAFVARAGTNAGRGDAAAMGGGPRRRCLAIVWSRKIHGTAAASMRPSPPR